MTTDRSDAARTALLALDFGKVDSESEHDLDRRFLKTEDFERFTDNDTALVLGAKGTGKSALFKLFTKHEDIARSLAGPNVATVIIASGSGFYDLSEVATGDIESLKGESGFDHDRLWRLYIAVKAGLALKYETVPRGPLKDLLRATGTVRDIRIGPLLKDLWRLAVGEPPRQVTVSAKGTTVTLQGGKRSLDVVTLLEDVASTLRRNGRILWLLFDKIDEIFPANREERIAALSGLMSAALNIRRTFPEIQPRIFLRTDLWRDLNFTNKSHLTDKTVELSWNREQLAWLLTKRACASKPVRDYLEMCVPQLRGHQVEDLTRAQRDKCLESIFPETVYPGQREAYILDWIVDRVTDGLGTSLPRETIMLGNQAAGNQRAAGGPESADLLLSKEATRDAFPAVSQDRCDTYLAEFPNLRDHFRRFEGQVTPKFARTDLFRLMEGLEPSGIEMLRTLAEIGVIHPVRGNVTTAQEFEIPRLYRLGLRLVIRGRP